MLHLLVLCTLPFLAQPLPVAPPAVAEDLAILPAVVQEEVALVQKIIPEVPQLVKETVEVAEKTAEQVIANVPAINEKTVKLVENTLQQASLDAAILGNTLVKVAENTFQQNIAKSPLPQAPKKIQIKKFIRKSSVTPGSPQWHMNQMPQGEFTMFILGVIGLILGASVSFVCCFRNLRRPLQQ